MTSRREPVVVGIDGSPAALLAVRWAASRALRDGSPLRIVHAYQLPRGFPTGVTEEESLLRLRRAVGRQWLGEAREVARQTAPEVAVKAELAAMPAITGLSRLSRRAAVLVLGNRGRSAIGDLLVGSTSAAMTGRAHCPVVLVREDLPTAGPVVVGVDGTRDSEAAVEYAFAEADAEEATLVAVHAFSESVLETALAGDNTPLERTPQRQLADETLAERLAGWQEKYPRVRVEREVVHDRPTRALRRCAQTARLVVVGRAGRAVLGSTSHHLLHHATCPVAVVRTSE